MKNILLSLLFFSFCGSTLTQVPVVTGVQILKAEDARRYDSVLEGLMRSPNPDIRKRAALAAGRIGDAKAIPLLAELLAKDVSIDVRSTAAFSIGEIESITGADAILKVLKADARAVASVLVTARAVEAAGKIAAANANDEKSKSLVEAIFDTLERNQSREVVLLALTAALRAAPKDAKRERPDRPDLVLANFLTSGDARVRADAANTLSRVRAKNANEPLRKMLSTDTDPIARANAARALGAAEDKEASNILLKAATEDIDSRVRVSALRSLAALKEIKAADQLLSRGELLIQEYKASAFRKPKAQSELLELLVTLGRLLTNTRNERAVNLIREFGKRDRGHSPEAYIARIRIAPGRGDNDKPELVHWQQYSTLAQVVGEFAAIEPSDDEGKKFKAEAPNVLRPLAITFVDADPTSEGNRMMAGPDVLQAYARFKTADLAEIARTALQTNVQMRATAAGILADLPSSKVTVDSLKAAFTSALLTDKMENDGQLAILDALAKLDRKAGVGTFTIALSSPDYLVRKKAFEILGDKELLKEFPGLPLTLENARIKNKDKVLPFTAASGTKLGQVLNIDADYRRALSRKNGSVSAVLRTEKGVFTIIFDPEEAPLTVDNFIKLARSNYFDGLEVHRVVPNFVMQDGDPRGDGNGGPGWSIRCEINMLPFDRGAVGMALSGKDTGGSQWFVTHSPQPHLDGGYTVFGHVNEKDMKVVDNIVRGDKIISVKIMGK